MSGQKAGDPLDAQHFDFHEEYVRHLIDGDEETERHFTSYFTDHLRMKLRSRLNSTHLIEDVRQETFLRFFKVIREPGFAIEHPERLGAFVNAICNNVLFESYRAQVRYQGVAFEPPEQADESWQPTEAFVNEERKARIREVLEDMPEKERRLLRGLYLEDRDKDELCKDFGVDREYLRVMLHRAKNRFRTILIKKLGASK
jgi:RNA polymerase sigma-70 factor (ECF subfamily)